MTKLLLSRPVLALAVAVAMTLHAAAAAMAAPGDIREATRTVYTLDPDDGRVHVVHRIALTNERRRGRLGQWGTLRIPSEARAVRVRPGTTALREIDADPLGITYVLDLEPLAPRQKVALKVRYDLGSVPPGFPLSTRITPDYARFCWAGVGDEKGTVSARIPAGWTADTTLAEVTVSTADGDTTLRKPDSAFPGDFYACTDAFADGALDRVYVLGPSDQLITIDGRPSHLGWKDAMSRLIATDLPGLETTIGVPMPYPELRVREVARAMPLHTRADFRPEAALLSVDEDIDRPGVATVALARTWFNAGTIAEPWLEQGLALWSGLSAAGLPCPEAGAPPLEPPPRLADWHGPAPARHEIDRSTLAWQGRVACSIVEEAAAAIGAPAMTQVTRTLLGAPEPADWRAWLDAVEAHPVDPDADVTPDFAARALLEHGVVTAVELTAHRAAE